MGISRGNRNLFIHPQDENKRIRLECNRRLIKLSSSRARSIGRVVCKTAPVLRVDNIEAGEEWASESQKDEAERPLNWMIHDYAVAELSDRSSQWYR